MSLQKDVKIDNYDVLQTKKPLDTSLLDMGISLTGTTVIDIEYKGESILSGLFFNTIIPILLLVILFSVGMKFL